MTVEFGEEDGPVRMALPQGLVPFHFPKPICSLSLCWQGDGRNSTPFVLRRGRVNVHRFTGFPAAPSESLQIRVDFSQPATRAFPVMLLVRCVGRGCGGHGVRTEMHL